MMPVSDDAMNGAREMLDKLEAENVELRRQRDEAMKTLGKYGRHRTECCSHRWSVTSERVAYECDCGLAAGIARVEAKQK